MADVTGPISTLPGSVHRVPSGQRCDDHADRPAVARVQRETDSFGSEMIDLCADCYAGFRGSKAEPDDGFCDWCQQDSADVRPRRDWEEGASGRVYQVCRQCRDADAPGAA